MGMTLWMSFWLFLNVLLLTVLVPGGPIENRDFSAMKGAAFWGFNVFLIAIGLGAFVGSYALLVGAQWAVLLGQVLSVLFAGVYLIDLAGIFPKSPTPMSKSLLFFEIINSCVAVYTFILLTALG
ncbi:hypothetical protein ACR6HW_08565 [Fusibacter sp. JL298sf-3]